jgi:hypothetical protein
MEKEKMFQTNQQLSNFHVKLAKGIRTFIFTQNYMGYHRGLVALKSGIIIPP